MDDVVVAAAFGAVPAIHALSRVMLLNVLLFMPRRVLLL
jgi:hypothetical protein